jgi:hypothetical protein
MMNDVKQKGHKAKIHEEERVGYLNAYNPEGNESLEHDEAASAMSNSGCEDDILSTLTEPEDWQRGYD